MVHQQAIGLDVDDGFQENIHPWTTQTPCALKVKSAKDPDLPLIREALNGPDSESVWQAMEKVISKFESIGTLEVVRQSLMPKGEGS